MPRLFSLLSNKKSALPRDPNVDAPAGDLGHDQQGFLDPFPLEQEFASREIVAGVEDASPQASREIVVSESSSAVMLRRTDQVVVAVLWFACAVGASWYFIDRNQTRGTIDIEKATSLEANFMVDINSANWPELMNLPGVGEKTARDIVQHRAANGRFDSIESLANVSGIGKATIARLAPFIVSLEQATGSTEAN